METVQEHRRCLESHLLFPQLQGEENAHCICGDARCVLWRATEAPDGR